MNRTRRQPTRRPAAADQALRPKSPDDIARIVRNKGRYASPVRVVGSGSATTRCAAAQGGTLLDLAMLDRIIKIDPDSVTVQAGIKLADLADTLGHKGLELVGGFDLANRTVGGAVSSAGLETPGKSGSFVSQVLQVKIVTADGRKLQISRAHGKLLTLARLSYGLLGIVYEVTLRIRAIQPFEVRTEAIGIGDLHDSLPALTGADAGLRLRLLPFRDRVLCELRQSSSSSSAGTRMAWRLKAWSVNSALPQAAFALAKMVPVGQLRYPLVDRLTEVTQSLAGSHVLRSGSVGIEQCSQGKALPGSPRFTQSTWAFPAANFGRVAIEYQAFCQDHYSRTGYRCDMPAHGYLMLRDQSTLLGPAFNEPVFLLASMSTGLPGWQDYAFELSEFAMRNGGVPLFSHTAHLPREYVTQSYRERLNLFKNLRLQFDAENRFLNPFFATYLTD